MSFLTIREVGLECLHGPFREDLVFRGVDDGDLF